MNKKWLDYLIEQNLDHAKAPSNPAKYHTTTLEAADVFEYIRFFCVFNRKTASKVVPF
ncbi:MULTISPECIES: hypothetical protein [Bacillaceae]|uniref:hypothetical protein n=1 Tax=Bacillaceae TaxID=186817 RepID=UPI00036F2CBA|nr:MULTISPECIES: hypothetical protein [Bacillaceae]